MKKSVSRVLSILIVAAMLISAISVGLVISNADATPNIPGDVNKDGLVGLSDLSILSRYIKGCDISFSKNAADVFADGTINATDYTILSHYITGGTGIVLQQGLICDHDILAVPAKEATCTESGNIDYWYCTLCGRYFNDASAKNGIPQNATVIDPDETKHSISAVTSSDGSISHWSCADCGRMYTDEAGTEEVGESLKISGNSLSRFSIVLSDAPSEAEETAASEMAEYLERIGGYAPEITTDAAAKAGPEIVLGYTNRLTPDNATVEELGDEGFIIRTEGDSLYILGSDVRGTLYGVYTFLEDYLDCRFYSNEFEVVPEANGINLTDIEDKQIPKFEFRDSYWYSMGTKDISAKNKVNSTHDRPTNEKLDASVGGGITYAQVLEGVGFVHTLPLILQTEIPSYNVYTPVCFTSETNYNIIVNFVRDYLEEHPDETILSLSHNDGAGACSCSNCQTALQTETHSGIMLKFINRIAAEFEDEYPNLRFDTLAYRSTQGAPNNVVPNDNVIVRFCAIDTCFRHPISADCAEWGGGKTYDDLVAWSKICTNENLYIWNYTTNFTDFNMTYANFDNFWNDMQLFSELGVTGVFQQGNIASENGEFGALKGYIIAKLLWDPEMTETEYWAMVDEFLCDYYGEGGKYLREFIDLSLAYSETEHFGIYFDDPGNYVYDHSYGSTGEGYFQGRKAYTSKSQELFAKAKALATPEQLERILQAEIQVYNYIVFTCQKGGGDAATLRNANETIYNRLKKYGITHVVEFTPWDNKYVNFYTYVLQWGWEKRSEWSRYAGPFGEGTSNINWGTVNLSNPDQS